MPEVVVCDTSCFIALDNINELHLLNKLYKQLYTTPEVLNEFGKNLPGWIEIKSPMDQKKQHILEFQIDKGEASAIILALETSADLIILDDYKARLTAEKLELNITGTLGIIIKAKKNEIIKSVKPLLDKLQENNFRLSEDLINQAIKEAEEI
ncbi:MAG: DUF3368 domain-containing protein [Candidatus Paceibacterota bacterium]